MIFCVFSTKLGFNHYLVLLIYTNRNESNSKFIQLSNISSGINQKGNKSIFIPNNAKGTFWTQHIFVFLPTSSEFSAEIFCETFIRFTQNMPKWIYCVLFNRSSISPLGPLKTADKDRRRVSPWYVWGATRDSDTMSTTEAIFEPLQGFQVRLSDAISLLQKK